MPTTEGARCQQRCLQDAVVPGFAQGLANICGFCGRQEKTR